MWYVVGLAHFAVLSVFIAERTSVHGRATLASRVDVRDIQVGHRDHAWSVVVDEFVVN